MWDLGELVHSVQEEGNIEVREIPLIEHHDQTITKPQHLNPLPASLSIDHAALVYFDGGCV